MTPAEVFILAATGFLIPWMTWMSVQIYQVRTMIAEEEATNRLTLLDHDRRIKDLETLAPRHIVSRHRDDSP